MSPASALFLCFLHRKNKNCPPWISPIFPSPIHFSTHSNLAWLHHSLKQLQAGSVMISLLPNSNENFFSFFILFDLLTVSGHVDQFLPETLKHSLLWPLQSMFFLPPWLPSLCKLILLCLFFPGPNSSKLESRSPSLFTPYQQSKAQLPTGTSK